MTEFSIGAVPDVGFDLIPVSFIIPNSLTIGIDGQQPFQRFDIVKRLLQLGDHLFAFFFCLFARAYVSGDALGPLKGTQP